MQMLRKKTADANAGRSDGRCGRLRLYQLYRPQTTGEEASASAEKGSENWPSSFICRRRRRVREDGEEISKESNLANLALLDSNADVTSIGKSTTGFCVAQRPMAEKTAQQQEAVPPPQKQVLSIRVTEALRYRLDHLKKVDLLKTGESVSTSEVAKLLVESARDDRLLVALVRSI
jgi:hypothetical protein